LVARFCLFQSGVDRIQASACWYLGHIAQNTVVRDCGH
jgi:hypothetical protein